MLLCVYINIYEYILFSIFYSIMVHNNRLLNIVTVLYSRDLLFIYSIYNSLYLLIPSNSAGKESACNAGDFGSIPGLGRSPGEGNVYLLQHSGLENSTDCIVNRVAKSWHD